MEPTTPPYARIVGNGCDVMIHLEDKDNLSIAHDVLELVFKRQTKITREDFLITINPQPQDKV